MDTGAPAYTYNTPGAQQTTNTPGAQQTTSDTSTSMYMTFLAYWKPNIDGI